MRWPCALNLGRASEEADLEGSITNVQLALVEVGGPGFGGGEPFEGDLALGDYGGLRRGDDIEGWFIDHN